MIISRLIHSIAIGVAAFFAYPPKLSLDEKERRKRAAAYAAACLKDNVTPIHMARLAKAYRSKR